MYFGSAYELDQTQVGLSDETSGAQISALFNEYKADAETKKAYANAMAKAKEQKNKRDRRFRSRNFR